jgi:holo-[acyl-carrier protein] synthase
MIARVGVDAIDVTRVARLVAKWDRRFVRRTLTVEEWAYCERKRDPAPHIAGTVAAKEAVFKVLGVAPRWQEVELRRLPSGEPQLVLRSTLRHHADRLRLADLCVSVSHTGAVALAVVVGVRGVDNSDPGKHNLD